MGRLLACVSLHRIGPDGVPRYSELFDLMYVFNKILIAESVVMSMKHSDKLLLFTVFITVVRLKA